MKAATLPFIKKELELCTHKKLIELTLRLAKHKVENKELLSFLLFEEDNNSYITEIKEEIKEHMSHMNRNNVYLAKKTLRKSLRSITKYSRYMASKEAECRLLLFFCGEMKDAGLPINSNKALSSIYQRQIEKIRKTIPSLEEDLQFDYTEELNDLL